MDLNYSNFSIVPFQSEKQSPLYHAKYTTSAKHVAFWSKTALSIDAMAMSASEHKLGAPVAVPLVCNKFTPANVELLWYKQIFKPSIIHSVDGSFVHIVYTRVHVYYVEWN